MGFSLSFNRLRDFDLNNLDGLVKSPKTPSPLTGEGWGEGELNGISIGYILPPLIPARQGEETMSS
jgi:hypothetical protein